MSCMMTKSLSQICWRLRIKNRRMGGVCGGEIPSNPGGLKAVVDSGLLHDLIGHVAGLHIFRQYLDA